MVRLIYHDLIDHDDQITMNHINRKKFVYKYADFLMNKSIGIQFYAFDRRFQWKNLRYTNYFGMKNLNKRCVAVKFLICPISKKPLFIKVVIGKIHQLSDISGISPIPYIVSQQKLLQFTTGSDRVPIGGLGK